MHETINSDALIRDTLTGAYSQAALDERLLEEVERARRYQRPFSLCLIELDDLAGPTHDFGRARGDQVLAEFAARLREVVRASDLLNLLFRYQGNRFVLLLPETDRLQAAALAQRFLEALPLSFSLGVASLPEEASSAQACFELAVFRLGEARRRGGGQVIGGQETDRASGARVEPPRLKVQLLGAFTVLQDDGPLPLPPVTSARTLLAYLLLNRHRSHSRSALLGLCWPAWPESRARRALRQVLWHIHQKLPGLLIADSETVQLDSRVLLQVDVTEFETRVMPHLSANAAAAHTGLSALRQAVQLYRGDLLEGVYEDWILVRREQLRETYCQALERLARLEKAAGQYERALERVRTLVNADPLRETAHREVMRLEFLLGRPGAALQQFAACRRVMKSELGLEPEPETGALAMEIAQRSGLDPETAGEVYLPQAWTQPAGAAPELSRCPLTGREEERALLLQQIETIFTGRGGVLLLEGEAGVGKTRLVQEAARDAEWRGAQVLWGQGQALEAARPHGVFVGALAGALSALRVSQLAETVNAIWLQVLQPLLPPLLAHLPDLAPPASSQDRAQEPARIREALLQLLSGWARLAPLVVVLEDLHEADEETWETLAYITRRVQGQALTFIVVYRGEDVRTRPAVWERLKAIDASGAVTRLTLARLGPETTGALIRRGLRAGAIAPAFSERLYRETEGNPLFVLEILRTLYDEGLLHRDMQGHWTTPWDDAAGREAALPLPGAIEQLIAHRFEGLPPDLQQAANMVSVAGSQMAAVLASGVWDQPVQAVRQALQALHQRQWLVETPSGYRFNHDKVRQATYTHLDPTERVRLHQQTAQALEVHASDQVEALAWHYAAGQVWDRAAQYHRQAGENAAAVHAYSTAVEHFTAALSHADGAGLTAVERFELLAAREEAQGILGRREAQLADLEQMAALAEGDVKRIGEVAQRRGAVFMGMGRCAEVEAEAQAALAAAKTLENEIAQAAALILLGRSLNTMDRSEPAVPYLRMALALLRGRNEWLQEARAHAALANSFWHLTNYAAARAECQKALALYEQINHLPGQCDILHVLGIICAEQYESLTDGGDYLRRSLALARTLGYRQIETLGLMNLSGIGMHGGQIGERLHYLDLALAIAQSMGDRRLEAAVAINQADILSLYLGDYASAQARCEVALDFGRQSGNTRMEGICMKILGRIARSRGDYPAAHACYEQSLKLLGASTYMWSRILICIEVTRLYLATGQPDTALAYIEEAETICEQRALTSLMPGIQSEKSRVYAALGQPELARVLLARMLTHYKPELTVQGYLVHWIHAEVLTALGQPAAARAALEQAQELLMNCLAHLPADAVSESLEKVPEHRAMRSAWEAVQPRRVVVRLPPGRPLNGNTWVDVTWTLEAPEDEGIANKVARRRHRLVRLLKEAAAQCAAPTYQHLAQALQVSLRTIEKDMPLLRRQHPDLPPARRKNDG